MLSPFELDLTDREMPGVLRLQYLMPADGAYSVLVEGNADRVWHKPAWLTPFLYVLTWFQIFFPETGENIPTQLHIIGGREASGEPFHRWNRTFRFKRDRYFNAVMAYDKKIKAVVEKMGPFGILQVFWNMEFLKPDRLVITSFRCCVDLGVFRIFLPLFLYPSVSAEETVVDHERIYLKLVASHPWLGDIFGYAGTFHLRRVSNP